MNKLHWLIAHAADLGLDVDWADLGPRMRGRYLDDEKRIELSHRLTYDQSVATLAHEIGHAVFGDRCTMPAGERRAWEFGASLAVTVGEYAAAEELVGHHTLSLATELGVTPKLIEAWRRWYWKRRPLETGGWSEMDVEED